MSAPKAARGPLRCDEGCNGGGGYDASIACMLQVVGHVDPGRGLISRPEGVSLEMERQRNRRQLGDGNRAPWRSRHEGTNELPREALRPGRSRASQRAGLVRSA